MRNTLLTLLLGLLAASAGRAQVFEPGTLVLATGDTLRGEIENRYWEDNPAEVRFRPVVGAITTYRPEQVRAFCLGTGRCFRSEVLPFDKRAETRPGLLTQGLRIQQEDTRLFAEVLVEGPASLLRSPQAGATHYFVRREARPYLELTERRYLRRNTVTIADGNNYVAQLQGYFGDCEAALQAAQRAAFTAEGLTRVVQAYNQQCTAARQPGKELQAVADPGLLVGLHVGLLASARYHGGTLAGGDPTQYPSGLNGLRPDGQLHPEGGAYADLLVAGRTVALHAEVTVGPYGSQGSVPARNGVPAGSYQWQGILVQFREGLRVFTNLTPRQRLIFVGFGLSQGRSFGHKSVLTYGTANSAFLIGPRYDILPYLEVGARQQRFTLTADISGSTTDDYYDELGLSLVRNGSYPVRYTTGFWTVGLTLGYQFHAAGAKVP